MNRARGPNRLTRLKAEYERALPTCRKLVKALKDQLDAVVFNEGLKLAAEPEARIKTLDSIGTKVKRKGRKIRRLADVRDVVGLRYVFLFSEDAATFSAKISALLNVLEHQDARDRLPISHFGYRSDHFIVRIPTAWSKLPAYEGLGDIVAEVQIRTMAQHLWAVASHLLQYKSEESVPAPLRRSLSRVAALLELVDSELSRVRAEKVGYEESIPASRAETEIMTLEEMEAVLAAVWPEENAEEGENYDALYRELLALDIKSADELMSILQAERDAMLEREERTVAEMSSGGIDEEEEEEERIARGVYFTHAGLTRLALDNHLKDHPMLKALSYRL